MKLTSKLRRTALAAVTLGASLGGLTATNIHPAGAQTDCQPLVNAVTGHIVDCITWMAGHPATAEDADALAGKDVNSSGWYPRASDILEELTADIHMGVDEIDATTESLKTAADRNQSLADCLVSDVETLGHTACGLAFSGPPPDDPDAPSPTTHYITGGCSPTTTDKQGYSQIKACVRVYREDASDTSSSYYLVDGMTWGVALKGHSLSRVKAKNEDYTKVSRVTNWSPTGGDQAAPCGTSPCSYNVNFSTPAGGLSLGWSEIQGIIHTYPGDYLMHTSWEAQGGWYATEGQAIEPHAGTEFSVPNGQDADFRTDGQLWVS